MIDPKELLETVRALGAEGVSLVGEEVRMRCPSPEHDDRDPSFYLNPEKGGYCFGCGLSFRSLGDFIAYMGGGISDVMPDLPPLDEEERGPSPLHPGMLEDYARDEGHFIEHWKVLPEVIERRRLLIDPENGSECFPIFDRFGRFWGMVERRIGKKRSLYRYPKGYPKGEMLLGEDAVIEGCRPLVRRVFVVEGIRDLCRVESLLPGERAVALGGAIPSEGQLKILSLFDEVVLALDNDSAGREGALRLLRSLPPSSVRFAVFEGKDPACSERVLFYDPVLDEGVDDYRGSWYYLGKRKKGAALDVNQFVKEFERMNRRNMRRIPFAKLVSGSTKVVFLDDPDSPGRYHFYKYYTVPYDYLSNEEKGIRANKYGRRVVYMEGDPIHPGYIEYLREEKGFDIDDDFVPSNMALGLIAYIYNITAVEAIEEVASGDRPKDRAKKQYASLYDGDDDFNGIFVFDVKSSIISSLAQYFRSGEGLGMRSHVWEILRAGENTGTSYQAEPLMAYEDLDDEWIDKIEHTEASTDLPDLQGFLDFRRFKKEEKDDVEEDFSFDGFSG